jgi:hypothetical protein
VNGYDRFGWVDMHRFLQRYNGIWNFANYSCHLSKEILMLSGSTEKVLTVVAQIFFRNSHNIPALPHLVARTMDGHETGMKKY